MKTKAWMGSEQLAYLEAVTVLSILTGQFDAELPPAPKRGDQEALETYAEAREALFDKYDLIGALHSRFDTRAALLDWAKGILATQKAGVPELDQVLAAFDKAYRYPKLLEELTELCLTLNPDAKEAS